MNTSNNGAAGHYPYVYVDGVYLKHSWGKEIQNIFTAAPRNKVKAVAMMLKAIHAQEKGKRKPIWTFPQHWSRIRTNNTYGTA